jgi:hypothetical protein
VETQPPQTGAPVKSARNRRRLHPLLYLGLGMIAMFALLLLLSLAVSWWNTLMDDLHYGRPRTFQIDAVVVRMSVNSPRNFSPHRRKRSAPRFSCARTCSCTASLVSPIRGQ